MGSQFRRYPVIAGLLFVLGCSTPTTPSSPIIPDGSSASTEARTDLKSAVSSSLSYLEYDSGADTTKSVVSSYKPGNLYIALRVNSSGFDPNNNNQFACADTSFWHFLKKFVLVSNKTFTLDATFNVGGFQLPTIPIMVLSDVEGMCKFYSITSKRVVPLTRVDGSSLVSVKYTLKSTDSTSFTLFDNIKPVIDEIATLSNQSVRLASVMSRPLMQQAADEFNSLVTKNSLVSVSGDVAIDFDFKSKKGLTFQPSGFPGNTLVIDLVVEPGFSVYTSDTIGTGSETRPKYNPIVNVYNVPVYAIEQTGEIKPISVKEHFAIDPEARQKFSRIHSANVADVGEFVSACGDIRDDLQNRVKLVSDDLIDDFVYILGQSHWVDTPILHNSDCITTPELDEARQLGIRIPSNDPVRVGVIRNMNTIIDNIMANLASSSEIARRTFFDRLLSSNIYFGDPSGFLVTSPSPRDALLLDLSKARISVYGCYYSPSDGPATVRTALFSTLDGKARGALTVYAMPIDDKTQVGDIKINEIEVRELRKDDPNSSFLISRIPGDARTAACGQLLEKYFAGFPGV